MVTTKEDMQTGITEEVLQTRNPWRGIQIEASEITSTVTTMEGLEAPKTKENWQGATTQGFITVAAGSNIPLTATTEEDYDTPHKKVLTREGIIGLFQAATTKIHLQAVTREEGDTGMVTKTEQALQTLTTSKNPQATTASERSQMATKVEGSPKIIIKAEDNSKRCMTNKSSHVATGAEHKEQL